MDYSALEKAVADYGTTPEAADAYTPETYDAYEEALFAAKDYLLNKDDEAGAFDGEIFHFSCLDTADKLIPMYEKLKDRFRCVYYIEEYSKKPWLEIHPREASKATAIKKLKELLGCDRVVCFGDGINDIPMFEVADECYAVANAADELKQIATAVIASNEEDGVAKWLLENAKY